MAENQSQHQNVPRFFVENQAVSMVALVAVVFLGILSYQLMPKQKDPSIPTRVAAIITVWPGIDAQKIELLVTKPIEQVVAQNSSIHPPGPTTWGIQSLTLPGVSFVRVRLGDDVAEPEMEFNDIGLRLQALQLPAGAGPIRFNSGFGDTDTLLLTLASPMERPLGLDLRAQDAERELRRSRQGDMSGEQRSAVFLMFPRAAPGPDLRRRIAVPVARLIEESGIGSDAKVISGDGFIAVDAIVPGGPAKLREFVDHYSSKVLESPSFHPDAWEPFVIADPEQLPEAIASVAGPRFTYRQLNEFSNAISRSLTNVHQVSKVLRSGVLQERVELLYSQIEVAAMGISPMAVGSALARRNAGLSGGMMQTGDSQIIVTPTGEFDNESEIGGLIVADTPSGSPVYLRELGEAWRTYRMPPPLLNYYTWRDDDGAWHRSPAVTLGVQMRDGEQIADFEVEVDKALDRLADGLPEDLILERTSDQPRQVRENISLFLDALYEAVLLVVIVALFGFWDWRSALLMMISIPLTLLMTFGFANAMGIAIQQVSVATLIIALGLLVDDPVVAGDSIKRGLGEGLPRSVASWLGPTKLASAIMFATVTNIIAYLPFVMLPGVTGEYLYSLPIVMASALLASRLVSMTFVPFLGYYLMRAPKRQEPPIEVRRKSGFSGAYYRMTKAAMHHRYKVLVVSIALMIGGLFLFTKLKRSFFPLDVQYLSTVDVWLPNNANIYGTNEATQAVEHIIQRVAEDAHAKGVTEGELVSITGFIGSGSPRFWQTVQPELNQPNYASLLLEVEIKEDTPILVPLIQQAVSAEIPGAYVDVKQLQTNPIDHPVAFRLSARTVMNESEAEREIETLRLLSNRLVDIVRSAPSAERVRSDWQDQTFAVTVDVDPDRASLSGVSNSDVSSALNAAYRGVTVTALRDGDQRIPVDLRLMRSSRPDVAHLKDLYVYPASGSAAVPLGSIADIDVERKMERIKRVDHFRTVTVFGHPREGLLASDVTTEILGQVEAFAANLPPGYELSIGGELSKQRHGFGQLLMVLGVSAAGIFCALVLQFRSISKSLLVFACVPFGFAGGMAALYAMGTSFSFMAFLGLISLVGVIVSHIIIIFDLIEQMHEKGEPFEDAVLDAGMIRLRPVLITVAATALALVPLAIHGGPMWQPLCYAQIGGLTAATAISLLIIPVLYAICVKDLKIIRWHRRGDGDPIAPA